MRHNGMPKNLVAFSELSTTQRQALRVKLLSNTKETSNGCLEWQGALQTSGYGLVNVPGTSFAITTHRLSYMLFNGAIPQNLQVRHCCGNKKCVNPKHLIQGTAKENAQDEKTQGKVKRAPTRLSKLDKLSIALLRQSDPETYTIHMLAESFEVSYNTVLKAIRSFGV